MIPVDFTAVFDRSPNPYMLLDRQLRYVAANAAYLRVTAARLEDLIGRCVFDVFPNDPGDPDNASARMLRDSLDRVVRTREVDVLALIPYRVPDGREGGVSDRFWSATHTPILDDHGDVAFVLQHTVDVTALQTRKRAVGGSEGRDAEPARDQIEAGVLGRARHMQDANRSLGAETRDLRRLIREHERLEAELARLAVIVEQSGDFIGVADPDGKVLFVNEAGQRLLGLPPARVAGTQLLDYFLPEDRAFVLETILPALDREGRWEGEFRFRHFETGQAIAAYYNVFTLKDRVTGAPTGVATVSRDITAQKRQEAERGALLAREREARAEVEAAEAAQRFLAEAIPQQVWTASPTGELTFVNRRVREYFNATHEQILGAGWQAVVHPDDLSSCLARWQHSLDTGEEYEVEFRLRRFDGTYRWHLARALAQIDTDGAILQWFGTNTDMDELTRARDELHERAAFERQVIGIVSHDLRNPLDAIGVGSALMLKRGKLDEAQQKVMRRLAASATRAGRMVRDFLDFTQARGSGHLPVSRAETNLAEIARQVFDEVHLMHPARSGRVEHTGEATALLDPDRIAQVIGNLVGNAFQHSAADGVVRLATTGTADEMVIEVTNAGTPIPAGDLVRLFEPFERGAGAKTSAARSLGLGLYIARQIVAAHGGTIAVRSTDADGTIFTVRLPRS